MALRTSIEEAHSCPWQASSRRIRVAAPPEVTSWRIGRLKLVGGVLVTDKLLPAAARYGGAMVEGLTFMGLAIAFAASELDA